MYLAINMYLHLQIHPILSSLQRSRATSVGLNEIEIEMAKIIPLVALCGFSIPISSHNLIKQQLIVNQIHT